MHRDFVCAGASVVVLLVSSMVGSSCAVDDLDRGDAVRRVMEQSGGALTVEQATCYVERVIEEIGAEPLAPNATFAADDVERAAAIRVDCIGVGSLGTAPPVADTGAPPDIGGVPRSFGDDPALDALWTACAEGYGAECDRLFDEAPLGSDYEAFGASCGGRTRELRCAEVYPAPGVTLPSPAQPPAT